MTDLSQSKIEFGEDPASVVIPAFKLHKGDLAIAAISYIKLALLQHIRPDALSVDGYTQQTDLFSFPPHLHWGPFEDPDLNLRQALALLAAELGQETDTYPDQDDIGRWASDNGFDEGSANDQVVGIAEEVGELAEAWNVLALMGSVGKLCRATNKRTQGIRGDYDEWTKEIEKELGDIFIKTAQVCDALGYSFARLASDRWNKIVSKRNDRNGVRPDDAPTP